MSAKETLVQAITRQRSSMTSTGVLDLSGNIRCESLKDVGSQKKLTELRLNDSPVTSLHTLPPQPIMKTLIADNSKIETLAGLGSQPRLGKLSLINTPVSHTPNFRLSVLLCVGPRLTSLNGSPITKAERKMAGCYPPIAKHLVSCGWIVQFPPPSELDFRYLADQFNINGREEDFVMPPMPLDLEEHTGAGEENAEGDVTFPNKLAGILRPLGFAIRCGPEMNSDIVKAVSRICQVVTKIEEAGLADGE